MNLLNINIENDELVIRIGIDTLACATEYCSSLATWSSEKTDLGKAQLDASFLQREYPRSEDSLPREGISLYKLVKEEKLRLKIRNDKKLRNQIKRRFYNLIKLVVETYKSGKALK